MKPLPLLLYGAALVWGATAFPAGAGAADPADAPPAEFAPLPAASFGPALFEGGAAFGDGTPHPWAAPPLPPLPGADLWQDYNAPAPACRLHATRGRACGPHHRPVLALVGGVLDGLFSLLAFPVRGGPCHDGCRSHAAGCPAMRDCGCYPPASPEPDWAPAYPVPTPKVDVPRNDVPRSDVPRNDVPRPMPPLLGEGEGLSPMPVQPEPQRLYPGRAPVVELAPDLAIPKEPDPVPPTNVLPRNSAPVPPNTIPLPGEGLPRNVIPPR